MKASSTALVIVVFVIGVTAGVVLSQLNGTWVQPVSSINQREIPGTSAALIARFDQLETQLGRLTEVLNRVDDQIERMGPPVDEHQLSENNSNTRDKPDSGQMSKSAIDIGKFEAIKGRLLDSLQDPSVNLATLMNSDDMRSLSREQQDKVMQEVAARLDSEQLSKEQFLPGYKSKTGTR